MMLPYHCTEALILSFLPFFAYSVPLNCTYVTRSTSKVSVSQLQRGIQSRRSFLSLLRNMINMINSISSSETRDDWAPIELNTWRLIRDKSWVTPEVYEHRLPGSGTSEDPYLVEWLPGDIRNPMNFSQRRKWTLAWIGAFTVFGVSFSSSGDTGAIPGQMAEWGLSQTLALLPISFFVLGFAIGPVFWAPLSEIYGRQLIFLISYGTYTVFDAGCIGAQTITQLVVLRFIAGLCGSAQLTNAGGIIADMFSAAERGKAQCVFAAAPFMGPVRMYSFIFFLKNWSQDGF